jgi:PAS domain-containing protein
VTISRCPQFLRDKAGGRADVIAQSHLRLTGRALVAADGDAADTLWSSPLVIVAHDTAPDPVFFFGNARALALFETTPEAFTAMSSRLSAQAELRDERARLMARVTRDGFIDDYSGIRISATGRRFRIHRATVWNLVDAAGRLHGQAAAFADWTMLAPIP